MVVLSLQVLLLTVAGVAWGRPTTVVSFSPVGYTPGVAPGFAYAFRAAASNIPPLPIATGRSLAAPPGPPSSPPVYKTQYHSQDQLGQYAYGYVGAASTAHEVRTLDGAVRGSYTYLDAEGKLQTATYVADEKGFRVEATNLPQGPLGAPSVNPNLPQPVKATPEVEAATAAHLRAVAEVRAARRNKDNPSPSQPDPATV